MRSRTDHQDAVQRRLASLAAELAAIRDAPEPGPVAGPGTPVPVPPTQGRPTQGRPIQGPPIRGEAVQGQAVPVPGRHARAARAGRWLPEPLRGRVALGPGQLAVVAVLVAAALAVTCWWVLRGQPQTVPPAAPAAPLASPQDSPLASPPADGTGSSPAGSGAASASADESASGAVDGSAQVVVDVAGKVRRPGIAVLEPGARVIDALRAAGGARRGVDLSSLNLARLLVDGEQILVGLAPPSGVASSALGGSAGAPGEGADALVNLNTADQVTLETLPRVGPVTAQAILTWREEHGAFTSVDELLEIDGIGEATLAQLAPHVTL